ncbi:MAG: hypothetical protein KA801_13760 [Syntrophorhabdaceae bacterium]|nr:hypothetical protein [Syntrophorhabdaceae bacterium]
MNRIVRSLWLSVVIILGLCTTAYFARGQTIAENLPLNTMLTIKAPEQPIDRKTVPKKILRYCSYENQKVPDYVRVFRFQVTPGQKYTFYDCHPAPSDRTQILIYLSGDTPLTNDTHSYGPSTGFTRGFVSRAQQPWPIRQGEQASCDLVRHNITIAPQSQHNALYVVLNFRKPNVSTKIMLKNPADGDDVVVKSTDRSRGTVWKAPFLLTSIPGEAASAVKPPVTPVQPSGAATTAGQTPGPTSVPSQPPVGGSPQSLIIKEAPTTSGNAAVIPYNCRVQAYINRGDYDTFRFDFPGGKLRVASQGNLDIVADLRDAGGNTIARDGQDARKDFLIEKDLPPGAYYIHIRFMYHAGEGPYTLILGNGSGPVFKEANP